LTGSRSKKVTLDPDGTAAERSHAMFQFLLTEEERSLLVELLENDIIELRGEIADTDKREYREMLKDRERVMKKLQLELRGAAASVPAS
jgi:hypothetical protein